MPPRDRTQRRAIPKQQRAQASAEAILLAAEQLLRESGFARLTTNGIARRAGVNVALVYRYFTSKDAIIAALIERFTQLTFARFRSALAENEEAPMPALIRKLVEVLVATPEPRLHRELFEQIDATRRRAFVQEQSAAMTQAAAGLLERRAAELRPAKDLNARLFVLEHALFAATHAAVFYRPPDLSHDDVLDALCDMVGRTLLP